MPFLNEFQTDGLDHERQSDLRTRIEHAGLSWVDSNKDKRRQLRIAHLSPSHGGVSNAAKQLHAGLVAIGVESRFFVCPPPQADEPLHHIYGRPRINRIVDLADDISRRVERHTGLTGMIHVTSLFQSFPGFDVIHLHGMDSAWFNLQVLPRLNRHHALVWTMHDKHLGTGACGFPEFWGACERWKSGCGCCPKAASERWWLDCTRWIYERKKQIVSSTDMAIVAPSHWMFEFMASAPIIRAQRLKLIPSGVDTSTFVPMPSDACRKALHLPAEGTLILAVASKLNEPRKGLQYFEPLFRRLKMEYKGELGLVLVGARLSDDVLTRLRNIVPVYALGKIDDARTLAQTYNASDLLVVTSMIDNFPGVVLEGLACGTPAAAFRVGGIPDMVETGHTGILSELGDAENLAAQMGALLKAPEKLRAMRLDCRGRAVREYSRTVHASRYLQLYHELCESRHAASYQDARG